MNDLDGKIAVVTGSSRGIGAAIAALFAANGARVVVHGRDASAVEAVCGRITASGADAFAVVADLTSFEAVESMRLQVEAHFGAVDVLVANAGGSTVKPVAVEDVAVEDWQASLDTNLTATFLTIKSFLPGMKQRGSGSIVTISSSAARRPSAGIPVAYSAAKAGIEVLTRQVAQQAGPHGVRANCIAPETIMTSRNQNQIAQEVQQRLIDTHPIRRLGTPEDVALAALFLATEQSSWISGIVLDVAGGSVLA